MDDSMNYEKLVALLQKVRVEKNAAIVDHNFEAAAHFRSIELDVLKNLESINTTH